MKILIAHNHYRQAGGEDAVVRSEADLLRMFGDEVDLLQKSNEDLDGMGLVQKLSWASQMSWSRKSYKMMRERLHQFQPDVVHFHNIFYMLSPSVYQACRDEGIPVVQSLHNFRMLCANGLFFRDGQVCEECLQKDRWQAVKHRCLYKSAAITALIVKMMNDHWKKKTWLKNVDCFITATEFGRSKFVLAGIPEKKIRIKPNFVHPAPTVKNQDRGFALYVGRLSGEKGVDTLLEAWRDVPELPLKIIGTGPESGRLKAYAVNHQLSHVSFLGHASHEDLEDAMSGAKCLLVPSICYENFPRTVAEAFGYGIPVVASRLGSLQEIITDQKTGLFFTPGSADDLAKKINWLVQNQTERDAMSRATCREFNKHFQAKQNYQMLRSIYESVITDINSDMTERGGINDRRTQGQGLCREAKAV